MARQTEKLTAKKVQHLKVPGFHSDGAGLYLQISPALTKSWVFRYARNGKTRYMGLGSLHDYTLAEAREAAREARKLLKQHIDPIEHRNESRKAAMAGSALAAIKPVVTFADATELYVKSHSAAWSAKHAKDWLQSVKSYTALLGPLDVSAIDVHMVERVLEPIWTTKTVTATRLLNRIESVLSWATVKGYRTGQNPAQWSGFLQELLPAPKDVHTVKHHPALPYAEVGMLMQKLRAEDRLPARALELLTLCASRSGEILKAKWSEFDLDAATWVIPAERMKRRKEHRVPLSEQAVKLLRNLGRVNEYVFPGRGGQGALSEQALTDALRRQVGDAYVVHGMRSCFRDWAAEQTAYPREVIEMALAHGLGDKTEEAYFRSDLLAKRRRLMQDWSDYCDKVSSGDVVPIRRAAS